MSSLTDPFEELFQSLKDGQDLRTRGYRSRFAPSPSGPLHLGNLRTALASWLRTRLKRGEWILRIDDLDTPRNRSGAIESIQKDLIWLGLDWDGPVVFQSQRRNLYRKTLSFFKHQDKIYPCHCSRSVLARSPRRQRQEFIYPGTCRDLGLSWTMHQGRLPSLRLKVGEEFSMACGDVVLKRADGFISYHLATVADELSLGICEVIRGNDLAASVYSQLAIINALDQKPLTYMHVPLLFNPDGTKISKRTGGKGIRYLQSKGLQPAKIIGLLASSLELVPKGSELSALELLSDLIRNKNLLENVLKD